MGVGKWQGWGAWGEEQEGRERPWASTWTGVSSLRDWQQIGGPPGPGLAGVRQGPGWENRARVRYLGQRPRHGSVR